ncbi:MAG: 30S ribosomal protein S16 [Phycisphaerae bacterium]|nr:30S ribosomal protein S16 [Phycisphaerae bacterium]
MAVKIRLKRMGRRHRSYFRVTAVDSRTPRDGRVIEELGIYEPCSKKADAQVRLNGERIKYWLGVGAVPSDTVRELLAKNGISAS